MPNLQSQQRGNPAHHRDLFRILGNMAAYGTQTGHSTQPAGLARRKEDQDENCEL